MESRHASGFVGSSIVARLNAEGISVGPIEAPRLATRALDVDSIINEADQLEGIIDSPQKPSLARRSSSTQQASQHPTCRIYPARRRKRPASRRDCHRRPAHRRAASSTFSSAAVQGPRLVLDDSEETNPFSAYSFSKALGEEALLDLTDFLEEHPNCAPELCILRATSVQGRGRRTTELFAKIASSPSHPLRVQAPASPRSPACKPSQNSWSCSAPSPASYPPSCYSPGKAQPSPPHPWMLVARHPHRLPEWLCRAAIKAGYTVSG